MEYIALGHRVTGDTHLRQQQLCQDRYHIVSLENALILAAADGHGSKLCPYSHLGAEMAVWTIYQYFENVLTRYQGRSDELVQNLKQYKSRKIPYDIVQLWRNKVTRDYRFFERGPAVPEAGGDWHILYGTTVLGLVITDTFYCALQLGDGDILSIARDGSVARVIQTEKLLGTGTYSLAQDNAWKYMEIQIEHIRNSQQKPALFMMSTDGYANSFTTEEGFLQSGSDFLHLAETHGTEAIKNNLAIWLQETTRKGCGDDIALVLALHGDIINQTEQAQS